MDKKRGKRSLLPLIILSIFMGILGFDRFYLGKTGTGVLKLITLGGVGIWALIDLFLIVTDRMKDCEGLYVKQY